MEGSLVYACNRISNLLTPVCYSLENDLGKNIRQVRQMMSGTPCILLEDSNPCKILSYCGVCYVWSHNLATSEEYERLLTEKKTTKITVNPLNIHSKIYSI